MTLGARRIDAIGVAVGIGIIVLAVMVYLDAGTVTSAVTYGLGPTAAPIIVAVGLAVLGVASLFVAGRSGRQTVEEPASQSLVWIVGGYIALIICLVFDVGFVPATSLLFVTTSRAFGRTSLRALGIDIGIGVGLALAAYLLFTKLLSLSLPRGPIENLLG